MDPHLVPPLPVRMLTFQLNNIGFKKGGVYFNAFILYQLHGWIHGQIMQ